MAVALRRGVTSSTGRQAGRGVGGGGLESDNTEKACRSTLLLAGVSSRLKLEEASSGGRRSIQWTAETSVGESGGVTATSMLV